MRAAVRVASSEIKDQIRGANGTLASLDDKTTSSSSQPAREPTTNTTPPLLIPDGLLVCLLSGQRTVEATPTIHVLASGTFALRPAGAGVGGLVIDLL